MLTKFLKEDLRNFTVLVLFVAINHRHTEDMKKGEWDRKYRVGGRILLGFFDLFKNDGLGPKRYRFAAIPWRPYVYVPSERNYIGVIDVCLYNAARLRVQELSDLLT